MADESEEQRKRAERLARVQTVLGQAVPHNEALGIQFTDYSDHGAESTLPYAEKLVGNPETGVLHGGVITALLDATCGAAVFGRVRGRPRIATIDLRIDYLGPATPKLDVRCRAECYKVTKRVAFVRGTAFHEDRNDPIASATGSFMIFHREKS